MLQFLAEPIIVRFRIVVGECLLSVGASRAGSRDNVPFREESGPFTYFCYGLSIGMNLLGKLSLWFGKISHVQQLGHDPAESLCLFLARGLPFKTHLATGKNRTNHLISRLTDEQVSPTAGETARRTLTYPFCNTCRGTCCGMLPVLAFSS